MEEKNYGYWLWTFIKGLTVSIIIWGAGCWKTSQLPSRVVTTGPLYKDPTQLPTTKLPFEMQSNGHKYNVQPLFEYELWGLVVSDHASNSFKDNVHESWNDFINTKDICVIWGSNITNPYLSKLSFSHGSFTCYVNTKSHDAWKNFNPEKLSNNHLIPSSPEIQKLIMESRIGDEIRIRGQLVNYNVNKGPYRTTSVSRTDKENGACEILYVTEFETFARNNKIWNGLQTAGKYLSILFLAAVVLSLLATSLSTRTPH